MPLTKISRYNRDTLPKDIEAELTQLSAGSSNRTGKFDSAPNNETPALYFIASKDDKLVGYACVVLSESASILQNIVVSPPFRKTGAGEALLLNVMKQLEKAKRQNLILSCEEQHIDFFNYFGFNLSNETRSQGNDASFTMENPCLSYFLETRTKRIAEIRAASNKSASRDQKRKELKNHLRLNADMQSHHFRSEHQYQALHQSMLGQARKKIWILSDTINNSVFSDAHTAQALIRLAKHNPNAEIRLLLANDKLGAGYYNPTLNMAQRLSSFVEIRTLQKTGMRLNEMITLVDFSGSIYRKSITEYNGFANFNNKLLAQRLRYNFDHHWQFAKQSIELRRLAI